MPGPGTRRYFDNAATSFPKPPGVYDAMRRYGTQLGASAGRGVYAEAVETARLIDRCRRRLCTLINGASAEHIIFTLNATDALNLAIKGIVRHHLRRGEAVHVITSWMDHNSVLRPYNALLDDGVEQTRLSVDPETNRIDPDDLRAAIRPDTRLVAIVHGSNVTGVMQPIEPLGVICRGHDIPLLVDAAQTLGHVPIDVQAMHIDLLAFPGHKGLLGPLGTGGLAIRPGLEHRMEPLREGGTGSQSERDVQPETLPDRFEPGSHNAIGIVGLDAALEWVLDRGVDAIRQHEQRLIALMLDGLRDLPGLRLLGPHTVEHKCGVFSVVHESLEPYELANVLERNYGILTRPGLHCAPLAHRTTNTDSAGGATRFSLGPFLTEDDVRFATNALAELCDEAVTPA